MFFEFRVNRTVIEIRVHTAVLTVYMYNPPAAGRRHRPLTGSRASRGATRGHVKYLRRRAVYMRARRAVWRRSHGRPGARASGVVRYMCTWATLVPLGNPNRMGRLQRTTYRSTYVVSCAETSLRQIPIRESFPRPHTGSNGGADRAGSGRK